MAVEFIVIDRDTPQLLPVSVQDYLPERHLARFVVEIVDQLDLHQVSAAYRGTGSAAYPPSMLVALLFYGYATGVFSSRKLAQATYDSVAFMYLSAGTHPDHRTIADFRKRFLGELEALFVEILLVGQAMGLVKLGTVSLDGTKIKANASKHKAMSWEYANRLEEQLKGEVHALMRRAEQADGQQRAEQIDIPAELARREQRLVVIAAAKQEIARRAQERFEREQAEYTQKLERRAAREQETGRKSGGKPPKAPTREPQPKDQVNFTDAESRIMPTASGGFEQTYNAQAGVDVDTHLIVEQHLSQHTNDQQEVAPAVAKLQALPESLGEVVVLLADTGYHSAANVACCEQAEIEPLMPAKREGHNPPFAARFADDPEPPTDATSVQAMAHRLKTAAGNALYAKRKATVETVFGIIKQVLGFRQFLLRGLHAVQGEWALVCIGWNLRRLFVLKG